MCECVSSKYMTKEFSHTNIDELVFVAHSKKMAASREDGGERAWSNTNVARSVCVCV